MGFVSGPTYVNFDKDYNCVFSIEQMNFMRDFLLSFNSGRIIEHYIHVYQMAQQ